MKYWFISLFALLGLCSNCTAQEEVKVLTPEEYSKAAEADSVAVILDVRRPEEFKAGHLRGALLLNFLDTQAFDEGLKGLDKSKTYYIYCRSGRRSYNAAVKMQKLGFKVFDMKGGITAWEREGRPVTTGD